MPTIPRAEPFEPHEVAHLGVWVFLATEVMFFAPLFFGYANARIADRDAFVAANFAMNLWLGTANTAILLTSSLTIALAARYLERSRWLLGATVALGLAFLLIKAIEYADHWPTAKAAHGGESMFYFLYFALTGVHAAHMLVGIGLVLWATRKIEMIELVGLYWHFVDVVWIFLFPMFYLVQRYP